MKSHSKSSESSRARKLLSRLPVSRSRKLEPEKTEDREATEAADATANVEATEALARLLLLRYYNSSQTEQPKPLEYFTTLRNLLKDGANSNIVICAHKFHDRTLHRLLHAEPHSDFFEDSFDSCLKDNLIAIGSKSKDEDVSQNLTELKTPFTIAAHRNDGETISILLENGVRLDKSLEHIKKSWARQGFEWKLDPFRFAVEQNDAALFRSTLKYTASKSVPTQEMISRQLTRLMGQSLKIAEKHDHDFSVASLIHQSNAIKEYLRFPDSPTRETIDFTIKHNLAFRMLRQETGRDILPLVTFFDHQSLFDEIINSRKYLQLMQKAPASICMTTLHIACGNLTTYPCKRLSAAAHFVNVKDIYGMSPLLEAVYYGNIEAVHLLLERGANAADVVNVVNGARPVELPNQYRLMGPWRNLRDEAAQMFRNNDWSAIHIAAHRGYSRILELLIAWGADVAAVDRSLRTALDVALDASNISTAFMLLDRKVPIDVHSKAASKLLAQAIEECRHEDIEILMTSGVSAPDDAQLAIYKRYKSGLSMNSYTNPNSLSNMGANEDISLALKICQECNRALEKQTRKSAGRLLDPNCHLCRLFEDTAEDEKASLQSAEFFHDKGAPDRELRLQSRNGSSSHPMRMISYEWHQTLQALECQDNGGTDSPAAIAMASHWLHSCVSGHLQCNQHLFPQYSPTRVLDLDGLSHGQSLRLRQNIMLDKPYITLSHRWGYEGLPVTTSANLAEKLKCIHLCDLSQTIQDAIKIVQMLGFRYLWIDALCIVQDSTEDWLLEASRMSSVFRGAICTIAVADSENHSQGIFRPRTARSLRPFQVPFLKNTPYRDRTEFVGEGEFYVFPKTSHVGAGHRAKGTLDSRAWILQEQLLSPRILYYGHGEIFWDCITVSASESSPISTSLIYDENPDETWALKLIRRSLVGSTDKEKIRKQIANVWMQAIMNYSYRQLTRQSDKLIALEGVLEPLSIILDESPIAGMWKDKLWKQLLWWTGDPSPVVTDNPPQFSFAAPSWSWLSATTPLYYQRSVASEAPQSGTHPGHAFDMDNLAQLTYISDVHSEALSTGNGVRGSLTMVGPSFPYRLTANDLKTPGFKSFHAAKLKLNTGNWMLDVALDLPLDIQCVVMCEDTGAKMLILMCLIGCDELRDDAKVAQGGESGLYKRIGLCHWIGQLWQVPKFIGSEPEKQTFTII